MNSSEEASEILPKGEFHDPKNFPPSNDALRGTAPERDGNGIGTI
jgi:hypothetical protein